MNSAQVVCCLYKELPGLTNGTQLCKNRSGYETGLKESHAFMREMSIENCVKMAAIMAVIVENRNVTSFYSPNRKNCEISLPEMF